MDEAIECLKQQIGDLKIYAAYLRESAQEYEVKAAKSDREVLFLEQAVAELSASRGAGV
ncbi:hypothetical protein QBK99_12615 [Corticibacterium sp. UT-5YL-CI-8]|nr:hypothetical protein [Tianweitania sp. UT-5YL-CI-8]